MHFYLCFRALLTSMKKATFYFECIKVSVSTCSTRALSLLCQIFLEVNYVWHDFLTNFYVMFFPLLFGEVVFMRKTFLYICNSRNRKKLELLEKYLILYKIYLAYSAAQLLCKLVDNCPTLWLSEARWVVQKQIFVHRKMSAQTEKWIGNRWHKSDTNINYIT